MKLIYFTVTNYRSITNANKIDLQNLTVLIGKNNEGKSNLIKALNLSMSILKDVRLLSRNKSSLRYYYQWKEDFPIILQKSRKLKNKTTEFRLDFELTEEESRELLKIIGSNINNELSVVININENDEISIKIPKRGKFTKELSKKINQISKFISPKIDIQYIPAIRSETDAIDVINNIIENEFVNDEDEEYQKALTYIQERQNKRLIELSNRIKKPLCKFMPNIKNVDLSFIPRLHNKRYMSDKRLNIEINDGVLTSLANKGDGVKSLTTIAILSQVKANVNRNRIIIVDEPENHLHPEAIHYIKSVLFELSKENQIIISTHNPIFTNRLMLSSNIIVSDGNAEPATRIDVIRKNLGVMIADNLMYSDYVIVVEGPSDKEIVTKLLKQNNKLSDLLKTNFITIRSIGGTMNLQSEIYNLERYLCRYIVVLDSDEPGINTAKEVQIKLAIPSSNFRYYKLTGYKEVELEELYDVDRYKNLFIDKYQLDVTKDQFKNKSKKWTTRIKDIGNLSGQELSDHEINTLKKELSELVDIENSFKPEAKTFFENIIVKIENDVDELLYKKSNH